MLHIEPFVLALEIRRAPAGFVFLGGGSTAAVLTLDTAVDKSRKEMGDRWHDQPLWGWIYVFLLELYSQHTKSNTIILSCNHSS